MDQPNDHAESHPREHHKVGCRCNRPCLPEILYRGGGVDGAIHAETYAIYKRLLPPDRNQSHLE
jgi:hypothetical protein